jgi:hypothetical protein
MSGDAELPKRAQRLLIFARAPEAGRTKTRLFSVLSPQQAADLHAAFVRDVVARHQAPGRLVTLYQAEADPHALWTELAEAHPALRFEVQAGADLGHRMAGALAAALAADPRAAVVLIGADSPTLPPHVVDAAFAALRQDSLVLGPATDGGYYLVGARDAVPDIFSGPRWGQASVLAETLDLAAGLALRPALTDVDRPADLAWLGRHLPLLAEAQRPPATARWWAEHAPLLRLPAIDGSESP